MERWCVALVDHCEKVLKITYFRDAHPSLFCGLLDNVVLVLLCIAAFCADSVMVISFFFYYNIFFFFLPFLWKVDLVVV